MGNKKTIKDTRPVFAPDALVTVRHCCRGLGSTRAQRALIRGAVRAALRAQGIAFRASVAVTIADDAYIREVNLAERGVDAPTDVLSFPMLAWTDGAGDMPGDADYDFETGTVPLGDIVISLERAKAQAAEYGHSVERECAFLAVHSALHLLGYDHEDEGDRRATMRRHEEAVLAAIGLVRNT